MEEWTKRGGMRKGASYFTILSQHLPGRIDEIHESLNEDSRFLGQAFELSTSMTTKKITTDRKVQFTAQ
jgi:hypothetical protein